MENTTQEQFQKDVQVCPLVLYWGNVQGSCDRARRQSNKFSRAGQGSKILCRAGKQSGVQWGAQQDVD